MPEKEPYERLRDARIEAGFKSATKAAERLGVTITTYRTHENGQNGIPPDRAEQYAKLFKTTPEWILYGRRSLSQVEIPILGVIEKKGEVRSFSVHSNSELERVSAPPGIGHDAVAVRVSGDGLFPRYEDGDLLIYGNATTYENAFGKECILVLQSGDPVLRKVGQVVGGGKVMLESWNAPAEAHGVFSYHPVLWVMRGGH